jgi:hypothetical protein
LNFSLEIHWNFSDKIIFDSFLEEKEMLATFEVFSGNLHELAPFCSRNGSRTKMRFTYIRETPPAIYHIWPK